MEMDRPEKEIIPNSSKIVAAKRWFPFSTLHCGTRLTAVREATRLDGTDINYTLSSTYTVNTMHRFVSSSSCLDEKQERQERAWFPPMRRFFLWSAPFLSMGKYSKTRIHLDLSRNDRSVASRVGGPREHPHQFSSASSAFSAPYSRKSEGAPTAVPS